MYMVSAIVLYFVYQIYNVMVLVPIK